MSYRNKIKRRDDIIRELAALDKCWIRQGRNGRRRIETRMHTLRVELRQMGGFALPAVVSGLLAGVRAW